MEKITAILRVVEGVYEDEAGIVRILIFDDHELLVGLTPVLVAASGAGRVHDQIPRAAAPGAALLRIERRPLGAAVFARQAAHPIERSLPRRARWRVHPVTERGRGDREAIDAQAGTGHCMKGT